jgi:hypothetical protein
LFLYTDCVHDPPFPDFRSGHRLFQQPSPQKQFLAIAKPVTPETGVRANAGVASATTPLFCPSMARTLIYSLFYAFMLTKTKGRTLEVTEVVFTK